MSIKRIKGDYGLSQKAQR